MTFKEFKEWCNYRAQDGCWGLIEATTCIAIIEDMRSIPFWRFRERKEKWKQIEPELVSKIVDPTNKKIEEYKKGKGK